MDSKPPRISSGGSKKLTAGSVWKGENETDPELVEGIDNNLLAEAGAWTEDEAYQIVRGKLISLRDLYLGQLGHMKHVLQEKRREFLLQWQQERGGALVQASQPSQGGTLEDSAYRCYRKRSCEEALLERKQKQRRIGASLDYFCKRDARDLNKSHYQYLLKLHQQHMSSVNPLCMSSGCENQCLPFSTRCSRHVCDDEKQLFYTRCSYSYPSGTQCSNPVPLYMEPPLCGGHCDNIILTPQDKESGGQSSSTETQNEQYVSEIAKISQTDLEQSTCTPEDKSVTVVEDLNVPR